MNERRFWFWTIMLWAALIGGVAVLLAAPVKADPIDDAFLDVIDAAGITYASPSRAKLAAQAVCIDLDEGFPAEQLVAELDYAGMPSDQAAVFVGAAIAAYCPRHNLSGRVLYA